MEICLTCNDGIFLIDELVACDACRQSLLEELRQDYTCHECVYENLCLENRCNHETCAINDLFQHGDNGVTCIHLCQYDCCITENDLDSEYLDEDD